MFLHVSVCPLGREYLGRYPPKNRYTPWDQIHPLDQVHPQDQVQPPTRYTPLGRYNPLGPGTPSGTRYTPWDQVHPPGAVHAGRYGQQAGGTHPKMHSFWDLFLTVTASVIVWLIASTIREVPRIFHCGCKNQFNELRMFFPPWHIIFEIKISPRNHNRIILSIHLNFVKFYTPFHFTFL